LTVFNRIKAYKLPLCSLSVTIKETKSVEVIIGMAIAEITIIPIGTESTSLSRYVADIQRELETHTGILFEMTSMSTIIEGPLERLFEVIRAVHEIPFNQGAQRVSTSIKIDDRRDKESSIAQKMKSVADNLQQTELLM
jgi:uncharacterized protein (TIGR00106 family)